jgi:hypothetical protein
MLIIDSKNIQNADTTQEIRIRCGEKNFWHKSAHIGTPQEERRGLNGSQT